MVQCGVGLVINDHCSTAALQPAARPSHYSSDAAAAQHKNCDLHAAAESSLQHCSTAAPATPAQEMGLSVVSLY